MTEHSISSKPKKRFVGRKATSTSLVNRSTSSQLSNTIPATILNNQALQQAINILPKNYNFEILKSVHQIIKVGATKVALQFPEGLLVYSLIIADILPMVLVVSMILQPRK
jgi:2-(3-amino-3-carboxypropyl)histidine synthase